MHFLFSKQTVDNPDDIGTGGTMATGLSSYSVPKHDQLIDPNTPMKKKQNLPKD